MSSTPKQGMLSLKVDDKAALYAAYMSFLKNGGLFVPTTQRYSLGEEVVLMINLVEANERMLVACKVVWVTPVGAGNRTPGVGVHFNAVGGDGEMAHTKIEAILGGMLTAERPTQTM